MRQLQAAHARVERLLRKAGPDGRLDAATSEQVKRTVNGFLDYQELAKRALGQHWEVRSRAEQREFVQLLRDLIEANYVKQLRSNLDYRVDYVGEEIQVEEATVRTTVAVERNGRKAETHIDYKLRRGSQGRWMAWDIITDEVSLVRNYRSQFNRIIRKESYPALVEKMRKKLGET